MTLVVGIVAEGSTDIVVIQEYLSSWMNRHGEDVSVEIVALQPQLDATSGRYGDGGWTFVKTWCEDNPAHLRSLEFAPLFEGDAPMDFLIVQLDGDRIDDYTRDHPDISLAGNLDARRRGQIVEEVLKRWLWGPDPRRAADPNEARHCLVATVRSLETWLVAGLDTSVVDPEEIEDPELELMKLEPRLDTKVVGGVTRLKKNRPSWEGLAKRTTGSLEHIRTSCYHCGKLLAYADGARNREA
ncbi:MAG: hypothetical protein OXQ29_25770 [Rhodospirillaceae bacterium]|nr:hypothetical protein [Rhodospirillaceae bacterium]